MALQSDSCLVSRCSTWWVVYVQRTSDFHYAITNLSRQHGGTVDGINGALQSGNALMLDVCSFGGLLDPALLLNKEVVSGARTALYQLRLLYQLWLYLEKKELHTVTLTHALVIARLNCGRVLLEIVPKLLWVQNLAAHKPTGASKYWHINSHITGFAMNPNTLPCPIKVLVLIY